jgi:glycosyltransferase involved in cell wall biosynthesis
VFYGVETLIELYSRIDLTLKNSFEYEVIYIHDGGTNTSWDSIAQLKDQHGSKIIAIRLVRNFGQHNAIICGIEKANGDLIITMDEDLQHAPEDILKLIECRDQNDSDIVYGAYIIRKHSGGRNLASGVLNRLLRLAIPGLHKDYSAYRLIKAEIAKQITAMNSSYTFLDGFLAKITTRISSTPVSHFKSEIGKSSYSLKKLIWHSFSIISEYSTNLINYLRIISVAMLLSGTTVILTKLLKNKHFVEKVNGNNELIPIMLVIFGLLFLGIVLLSDYIKRYNSGAKSEPKYVILQIE